MERYVKHILRNLTITIIGNYTYYSSKVNYCITDEMFHVEIRTLSACPKLMENEFDDFEIN